MATAPLCKTRSTYLASKVLQGFFGAPVEALCESVFLQTRQTLGLCSPLYNCIHCSRYADFGVESPSRIFGSLMKGQNTWLGMDSLYLFRPKLLPCWPGSSTTAKIGDGCWCVDTCSSRGLPADRTYSGGPRFGSGFHSFIASYSWRVSPSTDSARWSKLTETQKLTMIDRMALRMLQPPIMSVLLAIA